MKRHNSFEATCWFSGDIIACLTMKVLFYSLLIILLYNKGLFAQQVVFINKNGGTFREGTELRITLQVDKNLPIQLETETGKVDFSSYQVDSLAILKVKGLFIDEYYNEYLPKQFLEIDTVELFQTNLRGTSTPRFFLNMNSDLDSAIIDDAIWFKSFLDGSLLDSTFKIGIYHADRLSIKDKKNIHKAKVKFCAELGMDEKTIELVDRKEPYTTVRYNFFQEKTIVSRVFINGQNTDYMKQKAEEYSVVLMVEMVWTKR